MIKDKDNILLVQSQTQETNPVTALIMRGEDWHKTNTIQIKTKLNDEEYHFLPHLPGKL